MTEIINGRKIITMPITDSDVEALSIGDIFYLSGELATCRDEGHKRYLLHGQRPEFDMRGKAILHAGPIVKRGSGEAGKAGEVGKAGEAGEAGKTGKAGEAWEMVSIGPTTSMRMEKYEKDFIPQTGVKIVIGKGGMGADTARACAAYKALHCVFPGGCAVVAADCVERIINLEWEDLGMPEAFWVMKVKEFGPLTVSIDTKGNNLYENNKAIFKARADKLLNGDAN